MTRPLTGRLAAHRVGVRPVPPVPDRVLEVFRDISDASSVVSDILDGLGMAGAVPATVLCPTVPGSTLVGRALTVRHIARDASPPSPDEIQRRVREVDVRLADIEAHNQAEPGDVLVVAGVSGISSMGRISAAIGLRQGEAGAIVDGAVRDTVSVARLGYPVWSRGRSPITGKYRLETVAVNQPVDIAGITVHPGDLVIADDAGVVIVPYALAAQVADRALELERAEAARLVRIEKGEPVPDLAKVPRAR
ncbi:MAG: RraA family protein [Gemmatimonadales bacterium]|nr:RraA family protein [Gemmatimonadales bacterium]